MLRQKQKCPPKRHRMFAQVVPHFAAHGDILEMGDEIMVIAFVAFGILFGGSAAVYTMMSGGSFLLAIAVYSGVGAFGALAAITALLVVSMAKSASWDAKTGDGPLSA